MFYLEKIENSLRFGDVIKGFINITPSLKKPIFDPIENEFPVSIKYHRFYVIISPCCSISDKVISLSPLIEIRGLFFDNSYFLNDLTNINRKMLPMQAVSNDVWNKLPSEEKDKRTLVGESYALKDNFIYEKNDLFPFYVINRKKGDNVTTNYYMIDFRNTFKVNCDSLNSQNITGESKLLQLSIDVRGQLRNKISHFYARIPVEDEIEISN